MQLFGIDISDPPSSPKTWDGLVKTVSAGVDPVREALRGGGLTETQWHDQVKEACVACCITEYLRSVRADMIEHDRLYLPAATASRHGLDLALMRKALRLDADRGCEGDLRDGSCDCALLPRGDMLALRKPFIKTMRELVTRTQNLLAESESAWRSLPSDVSRQLHGHILESRSTLKMIARHGYDTLTRRPSLGAFPRAWNLLRLKIDR